MTEDYCTQFNAVFNQWDTDVQKSKDNEEKLLVLLCQASEKSSTNFYSLPNTELHWRN